MSTHQASLTTDSTDLRLTRAEVCRPSGEVVFEQSAKLRN